MCAFDLVLGSIDGCGICPGRSFGPAEALQEVSANGVEEVVLIESSASTKRRPVSGPANSATATARLRRANAHSYQLFGFGRADADTNA